MPPKWEKKLGIYCYIECHKNYSLLSYVILISLASLSIHLIFPVSLFPIPLFNGVEIHMISECTFKNQVHRSLPHG